MARTYRVRGIDNELDARRSLRDTRTPGDKFIDWIRSPQGFGIIVMTLGGITAVMPFFLLPSLVFWGFMMILAWPEASTQHLPMRMPKVQALYADRLKRVPLFGKFFYRKAIKDYGDPKPGRTGYFDARGIFFLGNENFTNRELYLHSNDMLTHMLLFGTTGAGKTEALLSLGWNSLSMGSGLIFIDPKGTNKLPLQIWSMARYVGREDDFLLINYSTGNRRIEARTPDRLSNTSNPFAQGAADFLSDIVNSLAIPASEGDQNAVFSDGAITLMKSLMIGLAEMRDQGRLNLSVRTIREYLNLDKCMEIATDENLSEFAREAMMDYLKKIPGFRPGKDASQQGDKTLEQFGYNQFYFRRALSMLTDTYGHIYGSLMGEVDFRDVVFNRRILCVVLPSMEKAPAELKSLGKVVLASIRSAMSLGLGTRFEGSKEDMLDTLPSSSNKPTLCIADEYGYVATEGFAVTAAQARGLGFSVIFAGQDYAGFKRGSETEAEQILANTKIKIIMALEDPQTTWELVKSLAGEASVSRVDQFEYGGDVMATYRPGTVAKMERQSRVDLWDLRQQIEGEFHAFFKDSLIRGSMFHANPPIDAGMRINRLIEVDKPSPEEVSRRYGVLHKMLEAMEELLKSEHPIDAEVEPDEQKIIHGMVEYFESLDRLIEENRLSMTDAILALDAKKVVERSVLPKEEVAIGSIAGVDEDEDDERLDVEKADIPQFSTSTEDLVESMLNARITEDSRVKEVIPDDPVKAMAKTVGPNIELVYPPSPPPMPKDEAKEKVQGMLSDLLAKSKEQRNKKQGTS